MPHDLIGIDSLAPGALTVAEINGTMAYAEADKAAATREAYESDWRQFTVWYDARAATPPGRRGRPCGRAPSVRHKVLAVAP
jgi:hypothetical protein